MLRHVQDVVTWSIEENQSLDERCGARGSVARWAERPRSRLVPPP